MGLPGLLFPLIRGFKKDNKEVSLKFYKIEGSEVEDFLIDFNGVLYTAFYEVAGVNPENFTLNEQFTKKLTKQLREEMVADRALELLEKILKKFIIKDTLYIAVDGVAPAAKMNQQRQRRWKNANRKNKSEAEKKFDTNAFTPGTAFMRMFDVKMKAWINTKGIEFSSNIIYDSFYTVGEGEHKLMKYLRSDVAKGKGGVKLIYGMDADLLMLSLLSPAENILLVREEIKNDDQVLNVKEIRKVIHQRFGVDDKRQSMEDFVLMMTIFGSDFFPRIPSLSNTEAVMKHLFNYRMEHKEPLSEKDGSFRIPALMRLFSAIPEEQLLEEKAVKTYLFPDLFLEKASEVEVVQDQLNNQRTVLKDFNYARYRNLWYTNALKTTAKVNPEVKLENEDGTKKNGMEMSLMIKDLVKDYLTGIAWMFRYYTQGMDSISQEWAFSYTYPPLLKDLVSTKLNYNSLYHHYRGKTPVNPIIQLLIVLPPSSSMLITSVNMRKFMKDEDLKDYYNEKFETQLIGTNDEWRSVPIIAPANVKLVEGVIKKRIAEKSFSQASLNSATVDFSPLRPTQYQTGRETYDLVEQQKKRQEVLDKAKMLAQKERKEREKEEREKEERKVGFFARGEGEQTGQVITGKRGGGRGRGRGRVAKEKMEGGRTNKEKEPTMGRGKAKGRGRKVDLDDL